MLGLPPVLGTGADAVFVVPEGLSAAGCWREYRAYSKVSQELSYTVMRRARVIWTWGSGRVGFGVWPGMASASGLLC